jgi:hypothetical protein
MDSYRVRAFENKVPREIFGPMRAEVTDNWKEMQDDELRKFIFAKYY